MSKGGCDFRQFKEFQEKLQKLEQSDFDAFCEASAKELAARLLAKVVKRTPVGDYSKEIEVTAKRDSKKHKKGDVYTKKVPDGSGKMGGTLRRGWSIGAMEKRGNMYCIEVINPTFYASYVEYGHRQQPGRYVPAIGKRLKEGWVKGKFMLTISEQELDSQAPSILENKLTQFLKNCIE